MPLASVLFSSLGAVAPEPKEGVESLSRPGGRVIIADFAKATAADPPPTTDKLQPPDFAMGCIHSLLMEGLWLSKL